MKLNITGGIPLIGSVNIPGSRASGAALLAAACYSPLEIDFFNFPSWKFIQENKGRWQSAGISLDESRAGVLKFDAGSLHSTDFLQFASEIEAGFLLGPLLYRFSRVVLPKLAWDFWESQGIAWSQLLPQLGCSFNPTKEGVEIICNAPKGFTYNLENDSLIASQLLLLLATLSPEESQLGNLGIDPEIVNLEEFLQSIGVELRRLGERKVLMHRGQSFGGGDVTLMPDLDITAFWLLSVLALSGDLEIHHARQEHLTPLLKKLEGHGLNFEIRGESLRVWKPKGSSTKPFLTDLSPYPGLRPAWSMLLLAAGAHALEPTLLLAPKYAQAFASKDLYLKLGFICQLVNKQNEEFKSLLQEIMAASHNKKNDWDFEQSEIFTLTPLSEMKKVNLVGTSKTTTLGLLLLLLTYAHGHLLEMSGETFESIAGIIEDLRVCGAKIEQTG